MAEVEALPGAVFKSHAIDVAKERSNAAEISVMDRDVRTAGPLAM